MPRDCGIDEATLLEKIEFMCFPDLKNIIRLFATGAEVRRQPVQLELRAGGETPSFSCEDRPNIPAERLSPSRRVPHWQRGRCAPRPRGNTRCGRSYWRLRSEERRVGKGCERMGRFRGAG